MTAMTNLDSLPTTVLLDNQAFQVAQQFATQEATPQKRERVFLNTLAVYAVHNYLKLTDTETNLEQSDSWHPVKRSLSNIADLVVPNLGRLECLPVKPQDTSVKLPQARFGDRIAYVAVQFNNQKPDEVNLLGYAVPKQVAENVESVSLSELKPFEDLFEYLYELEESQISHKGVVSPLTLIRLGQWLKQEAQTLINEAQNGWQTLEELMQSQPSLAYSFRSAPSRQELPTKEGKNTTKGKLYNLSNRLIGLLISILQQTDTTIYIKVEVLSADEQMCLPPSLKLSLLDKSGKAVKEVESNQEDSIIQVGLKNVELEAEFSVTVDFDDFNITENFIADF